MNHRWLLLALLCASACATYKPAFHRAGDDYRIDPAKKDEVAPAWGIAPLPSGELLSDDWVLSQTSGKSPRVFLFTYKQVREDGLLAIAGEPLAKADAKKSIPTLVDRVLNGLRLAAKDIPLGTEKPLEPIAIDGAEAMEGVYSLRRPGDTAPLRRVYIALFKPFALRQWLAVTFGSAPGQFEASIDEVHSLVRRFHFDSDGVPKTPGTGAPLPPKKPEDPAPPKEPSTPRYLPPNAAVPG